MEEPVHVLVVDDELGILASLQKILEREGYRVSITDNGEEALDTARAERVDLVLADIMMPKMNGIELLRTLKAMSPSIEVVMMTAFGSVENAVECMREGAYDFISKPLKRAIVVRSVQRALERRALLTENQILRRAVSDSGGGHIIGKSTAWLRTLEIVSQAAPSAATVLLSGESGTGKELLAKNVHLLSDRRDGPFVAVNCAALPESLLESELFGHERGAFTGATARREGRFQRADGGTIFLDEIGETSASVQVRMLRVLQEGQIESVGGQRVIPVDVRVVAATNRNLEEDVKEGRFREDLFYRLNVIRVVLPPLRDRHGDVTLLAQHFLTIYSEKNKKTVRGFSEAAVRALDSYDWPGNVRELENTVERAVVLCRGEMIGLEDLPDKIASAVGGDATTSGEGITVPFGTPLDQIERMLIVETLKRTGGDKKMAARLLGIHARTIYRKLDE
ncbi:MAG: Fis family transcriptional regulator [Deltaproteobacteria bacterium RIFOXYA12_FULL_58_15]|nr:MAG: Fis family transcriptional regulator [Deltaproteobacteria bacterium RIFOXYA12_FULL_58_15]